MNKTINFENQQQITKLRHQILMLDTYFKVEKRNLCAKFGTPSSDSYAAVASYAELKQEYQTLHALLNAKMATQILLGYGIVRPRSYLHEHDLYHYLAQMPVSDKQIVTTSWAESGRINALGGHHSSYLHAELFAYDILLLDTNYCMEICDRIRDLTTAMTCHYAVPDNIINLISDYANPLDDLIFAVDACAPSLRQKCHTDDCLTQAQFWLMKLREKLNQSERQ